MRKQSVSFVSYARMDNDAAEEDLFAFTHPSILSRDNDVLVKDNAALIKENTDLQRELAAKSRLANDLQQRNFVLEDEIRSAHRSVGANHDERASLLREKEVLSDHNKATQERLMKLEQSSKAKEESLKLKETALTTLRKELKELQSENGSLTRQLRTAEDLARSLEQRAVDLQVDGALAVSAPERPPALHTVTEFELRGDVQMRLKFLESVNDSLKSDNDSLKRVVEDLQRSITSLRGSKVHDGEELDALSREVEAEKLARERVELELAGARRLVDDMRIEMHQDRANTVELEATLAAARCQAAKSQELEEEIRSRDQTVDVLKARVDERNRELLCVESALEEERETVRELRAAVEANGIAGSSAARRWQTEAEFLSRQVQQLRRDHQREIAELRDQLDGTHPPSPRRGIGDAAAAEVAARISALEASAQRAKSAATEEAEQRRQLEVELDGVRFKAEKDAERAAALLGDAERREAAFRRRLEMSQQDSPRQQGGPAPLPFELLRAEEREELEEKAALREAGLRKKEEELSERAERLERAASNARARELALSRQELARASELSQLRQRVAASEERAQELEAAGQRREADVTALREALVRDEAELSMLRAESAETGGRLREVEGDKADLERRMLHLRDQATDLLQRTPTASVQHPVSPRGSRLLSSQRSASSWGGSAAAAAVPPAPSSPARRRGSSAQSGGDAPPSPSPRRPAARPPQQPRSERSWSSYLAGVAAAGARVIKSPWSDG